MDNNDDRRNLLLKNVRYNAQCQKTTETRENYFKSCEKHDGELAEVASVIRKEFESA